MSDFDAGKAEHCFGKSHRRFLRLQMPYMGATTPGKDLPLFKLQIKRCLTSHRTLLCTGEIYVGHLQELGLRSSLKAAKMPDGAFGSSSLHQNFWISRVFSC